MGQRCGTDKSNKDIDDKEAPVQKSSVEEVEDGEIINKENIEMAEDIAEMEMNFDGKKHMLDDTGSYLDISLYTCEPVTLQWNQPAQQVFISGTFNEWKQNIKLEKSGDIFKSTIDAPTTGDHAYKFIVDGKWCHDDNLEKVEDGFGGYNNVFHLPNKNNISLDDEGFIDT